MNYKGITDRYMIYGTLFALSNRIQTLGDGVFGEVTMKQHFLLISIGVFDEAPSLKEVADFMGCTYQNVKRMASALEKKGYINIRQDEKDHRRLNLELTEKVNNLGKQYEEITIQFMEQMFEGIPEKNIHTTLRTLERMNQNLKGGLKE